jgi:hypothetical protein
VQYFTILLLYHNVIAHAILLWYCILKGGVNMKKRVTFTLDNETIEHLKSVSEKTMIPQARIVELAIKEKLEKMSKDC